MSDDPPAIGKYSKAPVVRSDQPPLPCQEKEIIKLGASLRQVVRRACGPVRGQGTREL